MNTNTTTTTPATRIDPLELCNACDAAQAIDAAGYCAACSPMTPAHQALATEVADTFGGMFDYMAARMDEITEGRQEAYGETADEAAAAAANWAVEALTHLTTTNK